MRVLITNSLVLAAISLAPSASAAPYSTSSVDAYESYPNSTMPAQEAGPSSVPSMLYPYGRTLNFSRFTSPLDARRDEVIHVQSLYDGSPFGDVFGPVAHFFDTVGMNTISDNIPDAQKVILDQLHNALNDAAESVITHLPANHPLSPLSSRSLEDRQVPNPFSTLGSLPGLGNITPLSDLLSHIGIGPNPTTPLTDLQKQVIAKLETAISNAVGNVAADVPSVPRLGVLPFSHQARSVEERSLGDIFSMIGQVPALDSALRPATNLIASLGILDGTPLDDVQKEALSRLQAAIAVAVQDIETHAHTVHIEHTRRDHGHWDHHDHHHDSHSDDHHSHDEHKDRDKSWDDHKEPGKSWDEHKDENRARDAHKPHDVHRDDHGPHHVHKDDHDVHWDDHKPHHVHKDGQDVQNAHREGDRCREPRDGQWDDCKHHEDGKDKDDDPSLLKISLGHSHHH